MSLLLIERIFISDHQGIKLELKYRESKWYSTHGLKPSVADIDADEGCIGKLWDAPKEVALVYKKYSRLKKAADRVRLKAIAIHEDVVTEASPAAIKSRDLLATLPPAPAARPLSKQLIGLFSDFTVIKGPSKKTAEPSVKPLVTAELKKPVITAYSYR